MAKALIVLLMLAGCSVTAPQVSGPRSVWCETNTPRRDATAETPRWELDEINAHNAKGVNWCGWKP